MLQALSAAAIAGLVGSPHCVGMCGPFAVSCGGRPADTMAWQTGKTTTYVVLGALAGGFGAALPGPSWVVAVVSGALVVWFALALGGWAPEPTVAIPGLSKVAANAARRDDVAGRFLFGAAVGLLPCGLVYAALGLAVATGSALAGACTMAAFGAGTAPSLTAVAVGARSITIARPWARRALAGVVLVAGLWMVVQRAGLGGAMAAAGPLTH